MTIYCIRRWAHAALLLLTLLAGCALPEKMPAAAATVERIEVISRRPAFAGTRFGDVGDYELIVAVAHVKLDPSHAANRRIVDVAGAADPDGLVRYRTDVVVLRPRDAGKASGVWLFDVANRGRKLALPLLNDGGIQADTAKQAGNGWLMRQGHTVLWVGWQGDVPLDRSGQNLGMALPLATAQGAPIIGTSLEEVVFDAPGAAGTMVLSYPAATADAARAELSVRARPNAPATVLPAGTWHYESPGKIEFERPPAFDAGAIYQFRYAASDPRPMGLGLAAVRDIVSFLKLAQTDGEGRTQPLADIRPRVTVAFGVSQSGRFLRDFVWQGFNAAPSGGRVFDAAMASVAGSRKSFTNARWAQPGRLPRQHEDHGFPGDQFPFTYATTTDPLTGRTDGIFERCRRDDTCPKLMHLDSSLEFWQGRASLVVTDGAGHDVALPDDVRAYLMASTQHIPARTPAAGICQLPNNPARQTATYRALMARLIGWARDGQPPPPSRYPSQAAATLAQPQRAAMGFPDLGALGLVVPAALNELNPADQTVIPARVDANRHYMLFVPRTDADGHDIAGIRGPDIDAPLATHTGFAQRKPGFAEGELCDLNGSYLPLAKDARERAASSDPRPSIAERYPTRSAYVRQVRASVERLEADGFMLEEDGARAVEAAADEPLVRALPR